MNILVVDDHRLYRDGLLTVLKRVKDLGQILEASDGYEALNHAQNEDIDLALIDFHLPDTTGPALLNQIKELVPEMPIIIMSGSEDPSMIRSVMRVGASGFLPKSMEPDELISAINTVLEGGIYVPPSILVKLKENHLDVTNAQSFDYSDLVYMAKVTQEVISKSDWSIRAKHDASSRPEIIEAFNGLLSKMEGHYNELREHAFHDVLTGLPNRRLFNERLEDALYQASQKNKSIALIVMDVDKFKRINDELGHDQGDTLLKVIASRLKNCTREIDTASRFGGDEFAVILTEIQSLEFVENIVQRMFEILTEPLMLASDNLTPSISIGIALSDGSLKASALFKLADEALYEVKRNGRNGFKVYTA